MVADMSLQYLCRRGLFTDISPREGYDRHACGLPVLVEIPMLLACSRSPRLKPLRSAPRSSRTASCRPWSSCGGCSRVSPTTRRRGSACAPFFRRVEAAATAGGEAGALPVRPSVPHCALPARPTEPVIPSTDFSQSNPPGIIAALSFSEAWARLGATRPHSSSWQADAVIRGERRSCPSIWNS